LKNENCKFRGFAAAQCGQACLTVQGENIAARLSLAAEGTD
jgi:hypothetical protein